MKNLIKLLTIIIPLVMLIGLTTGCTKFKANSFLKQQSDSKVYFHKGVYKTYSPDKKNSSSDYFYIFYDENSGRTEEKERKIGLPFSCVQSNASVKFKFGGSDEPEEVLKIKTVKNGVIEGSFNDGVLIIFTPVKNDNSDNFTSDDILTQIDIYQEQYFQIIKRNNVLLQLSKDDESEKDLKDLEELYNKVKSNISSDCEFLKKYKEIEQKYAKNTGENTVEMNDFAQNHYNSVDKLLNDTYQAVKTKISAEEFNKLVKSEINWLKAVDGYRAVYDSQGFGSIGGLIFLDYQINMRQFRTLLLMLYL